MLIGNGLLIFSQIPPLLEDTTFANITNIIFAVLGILLTIVFYSWGKKTRIPTFAFRGVDIINGKIDGLYLSISYRGEKINNLSIGRFALWNAGNETIRREDVATGDPIKITALNDSKILKAEIIYEKNKVNRFQISVNPSQNELAIDFDFFEKNEGVILQIFHTCESTEDLDITGTIKGFGKLRQKTRRAFVFTLRDRITPTFVKDVMTKHFRFILGVVSIVTPIIFIFLVFTQRPPHESINQTEAMFTSFTLIVLYWPLGFSMLKRRVPKGFELFESSMKP